MITNLSDSTPAAPSGKVNVKWQQSGSDGSAYMPPMTSTVGGAVPTPPNDATKYLDGTGAFSTPAGGGSSPIGVIDATAQGAAFSNTAIAVCPSDGLYVIDWELSITQAASSSSTLGGANGIRINFKGATDNVSKRYPATGIAGITTSTANSTDTALGGRFTIFAKAGNNISVEVDYTSSGGTPMQYELHVSLRAA